MKCPINSQPQAKPLNKPSGSKVAQSVLDFYEELAQRGGVISDGKQVEISLQREFTSMAVSAASIPNITNYSKIQNVIASALGWKSSVLNAVDLAMTEAGATRYLLQTKAREASQMLQLAAVNKSLPKIQKLYGELQVALPSLTKDQIQPLLHDHVLIGQFPNLANIYDSPIVRNQLAQRYQEHIGRLTDLGVNAEAIKRLDGLAGEISQSFDNARSIAGKYGLDIKALTNGGYFPIQVRDTMSKFLEAANETSRSTASKVKFDTAGAINSSRFSSMPIVLDLEKVAAILGLKEQELSTLLTKPGGVSKYLRDNLHPEQLERMYDNGTLAQIPALSDELTSFFANELDLPFEGLGQAMILDPVKAVKAYNQQLTKAVENSSMVQTALEEGIKYGWVVDESQIRTLGNARDYVKVGSDKLFQELFTSNTLRENIADLYIHRTVADQLNALTRANASFTTLGLIGSGLQTFLKFTGFTKRTLIAGAGLPYLGRVFAQNAISLNAATGSEGMLHYGKGLVESMRFFAKKTHGLPTEVFAKVGDKEFSLSSLFEATFNRRGNPAMSITGEKLDVGSAGDKFKESVANLFNPEQARIFSEQMRIYHERYGSPVTGLFLDKASMLAEMFSSGSKVAYEQLAKGNQMLDFAARWTAVRTLAKDPTLAGKTKWANVDELLRYTDEYFNVNDDTGSVGKALGQYLVPFASFALVSPGVTVRHALRHPWRYARMMSLYSMANQSNDLTDVELSDWQKSSYPLFLGKDPETGKRWGINPGTVDSFLDTTTWAEQNFAKASRAFGQPIGSAKEQIEQKIDPTTDFRNGLTELSNRVYLSKAIQASVFGINPSTGEKFSKVPQPDTLLGFGMSKQLRSAITETLPILRKLDAFLPSSIVGESPDVDPLTLKVKRPGKAGFLGNVPSTGGKPREKEIERAGIIGMIANTGGLTLSQFDPNQNLIRNYNDFGFRANELKNAVNSIDVSINSNPGGADVAGLREQRTRLLQLQGLLEYNQFIVNNLAIKKGYTLPKTLEYVRKAFTTADDVPNGSKLEFLKQNIGNLNGN